MLAVISPNSLQKETFNMSHSNALTQLDIIQTTT